MPDFAVTHAIKYIENQLKYNFDYVVFLQPTSPLRKKGELDMAIKKCEIMLILYFLLQTTNLLFGDGKATSYLR